MSILETIKTFAEADPTAAFEYAVYATIMAAPLLYGVLRAVVARVW